MTIETHDVETHDVETQDVEIQSDDLVIVEELHGDHWAARRWWARVTISAWYVVPLAASVLTTQAVASIWARPRAVVPQVLWFVGLIVVGAGSLAIVQRLLRGLLPLALLLRLDLAFPGHAPRRFALALRAGNPRAVLNRLDRTQAIAAPQAAAGALLELVSALSRHDKALRGHSERVRAYSELVAEELKLDEGGRQGLRWAGLLHDVGKLEVPAEILNKTGSLTDEEWQTIRKHPEAGARLCQGLTPWLGEWATGVLDHHERWEGGGYPRGIGHADISLAGRVIAVTDAFDVMTSARSYKRPRSVDEAREELVRCSGTQFDPMVVRAFLSISVPRLRVVVGPLLAAPLLQLRGRMPSGAAVVEKIAVGVCVGCLTGLLAPIEPSLAAPPGPSAARGGGSGSGAPSAPPTASPNAPELGPVSPRPDIFAPFRGRGATGGALPRTTTSPTDPSPRRPNEPGGESTPPPGSQNIALVIDPEGGSVAIDGIGAPSGPPVTIVDLPAAGKVACDAAQVCRPVIITLPI